MEGRKMSCGFPIYSAVFYAERSRWYEGTIRIGWGVANPVLGSNAD